MTIKPQEVPWDDNEDDGDDAPTDTLDNEFEPVEDDGSDDGDDSVHAEVKDE